MRLKEVKLEEILTVKDVRWAGLKIKGGRMAYLLRTARGKENLIGSILKKHEIKVHLPSEKGFLLCDNRPSPKLLFEFKSYLQEVIEISEEEAERLLHPEGKTGEEIKAGNLVEVTSGVYQNFRGIVRRAVDRRAVVDLNVLGRVLPVEVSIDEMRLLKIADPWV